MSAIAASAVPLGSSLTAITTSLMPTAPIFLRFLVVQLVLSLNLTFLAACSHSTVAL